MGLYAIALLCVWLAMPLAAGAADVNAPFGQYPNCVAPSVPLEVHSWWQEHGEPVARHLHLAACLPNARDTTGNLVSISRPQPFTVRVTAFNQPGVVNLARWSWESDVQEAVGTSFRCQDAPMALRECHWWVDMTLEPGSGGLHELRLTPNVGNNDLGKRQFATLNYQIYVNGSGGNYRSSPDPIARSWYEGSDYSNVSVNYMDFFTSLSQTIPTVSGVVPLQIDHARGSHDVNSELWQDPDFHRAPSDWDEGQIGVRRPSGAVKLYDRPGRFSGTYNWDTRGLTNGTHSLYFQTVDTSPEGVNAGALKVFFNVQNGGSSSPPPPGSGSPPPVPGSEPCELAGDFNGDRVVDSVDRALFGRAFGKAHGANTCPDGGGTDSDTRDDESCEEYDLTGTGGRIDSRDFALFRQSFGDSCR